MKKLLLILLFIAGTFSSYAQSEDTQLFVSKKLTLYKTNPKTDKYELFSETEGYTPLIYGKDYLQVGQDPRLRFTLFGEVLKDEDEVGVYYTQRGFTKEGIKMMTKTMYSKKAKFIKVSVMLLSNLYIYDIKMSDEQ